jgi:hypothetical protein
MMFLVSILLTGQRVTMFYGLQCFMMFCWFKDV